MKKKIILSIIIILLVSISILLIFISEYKKQNYYQELKDNLQEDIEKYLKISGPYCSIDSATFVMDEDILIVQAGIDKEKLRDIDGNSYCKVKVEVRCVAENKWDWDTYLKCKDYEDENYSKMVD